ncbi:hypothetical protein U14_01170 [Candidatus Moduliflexus flocculans]|uniref:Uncharacterized protein n=1 Tax=Candidatus Moduliflexus flocculans TaxID=1499966 RepID=A0A0S6VW41_9BACT|nr:hypothetical protein U14_01170 [Candidatus Moduliflexus flocculans]
MLCPFCMNQHAASVTVCPEKEIRIPSVYVEDVRHGVPVVVMLTIGYSGHGKTCFLSSLFHSLYHDSVSEKWPGFSFIGLTMETLNRIHHEFVTILDHGNLPPKTPIMFPTPLILKFQRIPLKVKNWFKKHLQHQTIEQRELIVIFYDIGGGTFDVDEKIRQNIPVLREISTLIFLLSLPQLLNEANENNGISVVQRLHKLLNTIVIAMRDLGQNQQKNIQICFTMGDEMWDQENLLYGPLSMRLSHPIPPADDFSAYFAASRSDSKIIQDHVESEYRAFYNTLANNFGQIRFTSVSSLGAQPTQDGRILNLAPNNVFDPLLSLLELEGLL